MPSIIIKNKQNMTKIALSDIYYIKSHPTKPHYLQVVADSGTYDYLQKLSQLEHLHSTMLVRCHRNCLVNVSKIREIQLKDKQILLGNDGQYQVTFSRRRYHQLLKIWLK